MRSPFLPATLALLALPALQAAPEAPRPVNPLLGEWNTPFGLPPFQQIKESDYLPAFKEALARNKAEIQAIAANPEAPTFANTIEALEDSGELLDRVGAVFSNVKGAASTPGLQAVAAEITPLLSSHEDDIAMNAALFKRVQAVYEQRDHLRLTPEQRMLLVRRYRAFQRGGAALDEAGKARLRKANGELSLLGLKFSENVLKETGAFALVVDRKEDLAGLPEGSVAAAAETARKRGMGGKWVFTLDSPSIWPFLQYAQNRELRRRIMEAYLGRGNHGDAQDNNANLARIAALRVEKARILGFATWADFVLDDTMAKTPAGVYKLLDQIWKPALKVASRELAELQAMADKEKAGIRIESWDWRYYAEKVKKARYDLDEQALRPYFSLERVRDGAFMVANRLYGITFTELKDMPVYHPDVRCFEVKDRDGSHLAVLYLDYHARSGAKRPGAWMTNYRDQWIRGGQQVRPVIVNVCNFPSPVGDQPALISLEDVETLFHEFGHGLHGILANGRYRSLSGSSVARDFVELPSQIMENWATEPEVMRLYARHWKTGEVIPDALIDRIQKSRHFNQGFTTVEYMAASLLDMAWHTQKDARPVDTQAFEQKTLKDLGLMPQIPVRYRSTYFNHIVGGYSAGYYSYIWAEVLDADAFQAFKEKGDLFHQPTASSFRKNVLSMGGTEEPMVLYRRFRGSEPTADALLKRRGLK